MAGDNEDNNEVRSRADAAVQPAHCRCRRLRRLPACLPAWPPAHT